MKLTPLENWIMRKTGINERNRDLLEEYQLNRIRETIAYAKNYSRFYREHLKNISPDEICSFFDFQNIPFTYPCQISSNPLDFLCVSLSEIKRIVTLKSSGTSGENKRIYLSEKDLNLTLDFFDYGMSCLVDQSDRVMVLLPGKSYGSIGDLLKKALSVSAIECFVCGVMTDVRKTAKFIVENNITCIVGIPVQVLYLSRAESEAFKKIKKVLLSTDYVPEVLIHELTARYGCRVFTHYGMTEMGYGGGVECCALSGYHMREADLYFEIINPESGQTVEDGQSGEVVFTTLTRKAMPLIRYRTGDIASFSAAPCACGTFLKTMNRVQGRANNKICIGKNRYIYLTELDEIIFSFREAVDYKACLKNEGCLLIEIAAGNDKAYENVNNIILHDVEEFIHNKFSDNIKLQIELRQNNEFEKIVNSMVKRKICDLTKSEAYKP